MSVLKTSSLAAVLILSMGLAACGTTAGYYNPATGASVAVVQEPAACLPGEDFGGRVCSCQEKNGQYVNCAFRAVGVAPATPWLNCLLDPYVQYHQECLAHRRQQSYNQGGYQRPGSPFYMSSPAPGYSSTYYCSGRAGDRRCDNMPAR